MVDFLVMGNIAAMFFKNASKLFIEDRINVGYNMVQDFEDNKKAATYWYTTFDTQKDPIELKCVYDEDKYYRYINYDAINVNNINDIPINYDGVIGVPITFIQCYDKRQFDIVSITVSGNDKISIKEDDIKRLKQWNNDWRLHHPVILKDGEYVLLFDKLLIKKRIS